MYSKLIRSSLNEWLTYDSIYFIDIVQFSYTKLKIRFNKIINVITKQSFQSLFILCLVRIELNFWVSNSRVLELSLTTPIFEFKQLENVSFP